MDDYNLSVEQLCEMARQRRAEREKQDKYYEDMRRQELKKQGLTMIETQKMTPEEQHEYERKHHDHPDTMEDGQATFLWIVCSIGALIFKQGWVLIIIFTLMLLKHIARHDNK